VNKFQGTWRSIVGSDTIIIKLVKVSYNYYKPTNSSADRIAGTHYYGENGRLVESSMPRYDSVVNGFHKRSTILASNTNFTDTSTVEGTFYDISKKKLGNLVLQYVDGSTPQLIWNLKNLAGVVAVLPGKTFDSTFTLPVSLTFTKQ
jgi:hypothetical protein